MGSEGTEVTEESVPAIRTKLESALAENKALRDLVGSTFTEKFPYIKGEDLTGLPVDQLAAKAAEIHGQRAKEREEIFRTEAERRGIKLDGTAMHEGVGTALSQAASLASVQGTPVGQVTVDPSKMSPKDKIIAGLSGIK